MVGKIKLLCVVSMCTALWFSMYGGSKSTVITHVEHRTGPLGNGIVLTFNAEPMCHFLPQTAEQAEQAERLFSKTESGATFSQKDKDSLVELQFFLPTTSVEGKKNKQLLQQINATCTLENNSLYGILFEPTNLPVPGYRCTVTFKPAQTGFQLDVTQAHGQPALAFNFYSYALLNTINHAVNTVRQTA